MNLLRTVKINLNFLNFLFFFKICSAVPGHVVNAIRSAGVNYKTQPSSKFPTVKPSHVTPSQFDSSHHCVRRSCALANCKVTVRGTCLDILLANSNFHIRLTDRMCCATNVLIKSRSVSFNIQSSLSAGPRWFTHADVTSQPGALCSPFLKQFCVPTPAVTSYKICTLKSPNRSGVVVKSKTLTGFHKIWYRLVLVRSLKQFQLLLISHNNEHSTHNLLVFLCSSGAVSH